MERLRMLPFFKLLIPFILGVLVAKYISVSSLYFNIILLLISFCLALIYQRVRFENLRGGMIKSLYFSIHFFCWGIFIYSYHTIHFKKALDQSNHSYILKSGWSKKNDYFRARAAFDQSSILKNGDLLIYYRSDEKPDGSPGDQIITFSKYHRLKEPSNPGEFDYRSYLEMQGIAYSLFIKENQFMIKEKDSFSLLRLFTKFREELIRRIESYPLTGDSKALIKALVLGDKSSLDPEISSGFSVAGASHVLAVSGLHVGIIVILFTKLLSLIKISRSNSFFRWFKVLILLFIIWSFAGVSGFSPSIIRASIMFSFISIGQSLTRNTSIYNSLSMAAFFMLLINPNNLFNVGFQLSFLAVLSIVFFYDRIYTSLYFRNRFFQKIWSISSVSIAAQIGTFPLALYYFHQFPVYFILSNLIVIPAAFIILLLSILLLFSPLVLMIDLFSIVLNTIISLLNRSILLIGKIPFSAIKEVYISEITLFTIFFILLSFSVFLQTKKRVYILYTLALACVLFSVILYEKITYKNDNRLIIYSIPNQNAIDLIQGDHHTLFIDSTLFQDPDKLLYAGNTFWKKQGLNSFENSIKVAFGKNDDLSTSSSYLLGKSHLILKNSVICFNHSSHEDQLIKTFQNKIALINKAGLIEQIQILNYDKIVLNTKLNIVYFDFLKTEYSKSMRPKIHHLAIDGYFEITY